MAYVSRASNVPAIAAMGGLEDELLVPPPVSTLATEAVGYRPVFVYRPVVVGFVVTLTLYVSIDQRLFLG
jgi:hypothetical protein